MTDVSPSSFDRFFEEVHGYPPFPWQSRLARDVAERGRFPATLDLPTGTGKTSVIDIAVFGLAVQLARGGERSLPYRLGFVVDRRTVVDQSHQRAAQLAEKLAAARGDSATARVAKALRRLSMDGGRPLHVAVLRGAIPRDDSWARTPTQPTVLLSTVDQVGSRLFFRGYGVSQGMRPIHAGLLGNDLLLVLDEVHLARPFCDTLRMLETYYEDRVGQMLPRRFQVVELSATHHNIGDGQPFRLDEADYAHPVLQARLSAPKPTDLRRVSVKGDEGERVETLATRMTEAAAHAAVAGNAVGVVVNRVAGARSIHQRLQRRIAAGKLDAEVWLLTGRMRPLDRQDLEQRVRARLGAGRSRDVQGSSVILVSTQCIEAGADLDFDVLLTECASLDALRQRFGRLNRLGQAPGASGAVFARSDIDKPDPVYGNAAGYTWAYLSSLQKVDLGLEALAIPQGDDLTQLLAPSTTSPILLPAHLESWSQTSPPPEPDPAVGLWLHGADEQSPREISVVWREDITVNELDRIGAESQSPVDGVRERLEACPPLSSEAVSIPIWAARAWLCRKHGAESELSDIDREQTAARDEASSVEGRFVVVWRGEACDVAGADALRPGDVIVVPAAYGGLTAGSWDPASTDVVEDLAERAHIHQRGRALLRADPTLSWCNATDVPKPTGDEADDPRSETEALDAFLKDAGANADKPWLRDIACQLRIELSRSPGPRRIVVANADGRECYVLVSRVRQQRWTEFTSAEVAADGDAPSLLGRPVTLREHLDGVARLARRYAAACGLSEFLCDDLELAAKLHDYGKEDPRFQQMLHQGSEYRALTAPEPLAKSAIAARDRRSREQARERARYPAGTRHELLSLALLEQSEKYRHRAHDWDLVLHLVASHHGHCRPFAPVEPTSHSMDVHTTLGDERLSAPTAHGLARIDSGVSDRYFDLVDRYGCHGLAWLESILRLADHRQSELEERGES